MNNLLAIILFYLIDVYVHIFLALLERYQLCCVGCDPTMLRLMFGYMFEQTVIADIFLHLTFIFLFRSTVEYHSQGFQLLNNQKT